MALNTSVRTPITGPVHYVGISKHPCPVCNGQLLRTRRRPIDRIASLFKPVQRYRCHVFSCKWQGNFSVDAQRNGFHGDRRANRKPVSFIVHMVLTAVGVVLVLVLTTTDWLSYADQANSDDASVSHYRSAALIGRTAPPVSASDKANKNSQTSATRSNTQAR